MTLLDAVTLLLLFLMGFGLWGMFLEWMHRGDLHDTRVSQCPPHDWHPTYRDIRPDEMTVKTDPRVPIFAGLRCGKCKRGPDGLRNGESWRWPSNPTPP